jgi:hypothetical protein
VIIRPVRTISRKGSSPLSIVSFEPDRSVELAMTRILRGHTQSSLLKRRDEDMVHALQRCRDDGAEL